MNTSSSAAIITPQQAKELAQSHIFLDVRTPVEFNEAHISGSSLHPLNELDPAHVRGLIGSKSGCVIVCRSGGRARQAYERLTASGIANVSVLDGGIMAWDNAGFAVVRGGDTGAKKVISLERQVRIAAGGLVVLGVLLGVTLHSALLIIPAFVGAGLVFAGISDSCGMAMVLARMPWNTAGGTATTKNTAGGCCLR
jgi:rhodanese-related sulfurtransferase